MKIQLALDDISLEGAKQLLQSIEKYVDIIEVGTPMIIEYGVRAIKELRRIYTDKLITADPKIMDAGEYEAEQCFSAGANIVTVMGVTNDETFTGALKAAKRYNGKIMADMMRVENIPRRGKQLLDLGVDFIAIHTAVDVQDQSDPLREFKELLEVVPSEKICVAGGINGESLGRYTNYNPGIIIVGSGITKQYSPLEAAKTINQQTQI